MSVHKISLPFVYVTPFSKNVWQSFDILSNLVFTVLQHRSTAREIREEKERETIYRSQEGKEGLRCPKIVHTMHTVSLLRLLDSDDNRKAEDTLMPWLLGGRRMPAPQRPRARTLWLHLAGVPAPGPGPACRSHRRAGHNLLVIEINVFVWGTN